MTETKKLSPSIAKHTETPWLFANGRIITPDNEVLVLNGVSLPCGNHPDDAEATANAAFIVRAVNNHKALLRALRSAKKSLVYRLSDKAMQSVLCEINDAIEAAERFRADHREKE